MSPADRQRRIVAALEDYQRHKALGRAPDPMDYREALGDEYEEFLRLLEAAEAIDRAKAPPAEPNLPRAFGPYVLERVIGGGGMGIVYEALHRDLVRRVAVKVLPRTLDADPSMVERFRREARACAQVRHPNVVTVYEAGDVDGQLYYAMELVEGRTLQAHVDEGTVPPPRELFAALAEVADALDTLHAAGVVHRDVKPANLIVRPDGHVVLADFGLARTLYGGHLTQTGEALGTPPYMSPEQLLGRVRDVDARTDVYGLGATLYHALVGSPPFAATDPQDLVRMVMVQRPDPISRRRPEGAPALEPGVEAVVMKALEKRKEDRYVTAGALRDDLRAVAAGDQPVGRPVPPWRRALRGARPFALPVAAAVGLLVGGLAWWNAQPGTLRVDLSLPADVFVDGVTVGRLTEGRPLDVALAPGEHRVQLVGRAFRTDEEVVRIRPMADKTYTVMAPMLKVTDVDDPAVMQEFSRFLRLDWRRWTQLERSRAMASGPAAFLPRGDVRVEDLDVVEVYVPAGYVSEAKLVVFFARDGVDLVAPLAFPPDAALDELMAPQAQGAIVPFPVPEAVRAALKPGDVLTWGLRPARGRGPATVSTRAQVVASDAAPALADLDRQLAGQPAALAAVFRSRYLRERGLHTAAARAVLASVPAAERGFYAWLALHDALRGAGVPVDVPAVEAAAAAIKARKGRPAFEAHPGLVPDDESPR
ncbi:MAG: serine/threonine-protein kinase [Planctomycetota bacterium]